jgi:hypothetical protein
MVKFIALEVPPPGMGFVTVTAGVPTEAMAAAGIAAVNCVELTNVVVRAVPPKVTIEPAMKFVPLIVSVKAAAPTGAVFGEIVAIVGAGGCCGLLSGWLVPPPHPARNTKLTSPKFTSSLIIAASIFMKPPFQAGHSNQGITADWWGEFTSGQGKFVLPDGFAGHISAFFGGWQCTGGKPQANFR